MRSSSHTLHRLGPLAEARGDAHDASTRDVRRQLLGARVEDDPLELRARGPVELLDLSLELLRRHFALFFGMGCAAWLPLRVLLTWTASEHPTLHAGLALILGAACQVLLTTWLAVLARDRLHGLEGTRGAPRVARELLRRAPGVMLLSLLVGVASGVGVCACIVGTYLVQWLFALAPMIYAVEPVGLRAALGRSLRLVRGSFWRWAAWTVLMVVLTAPLIGVQSLLETPGMASNLPFGGWLHAPERFWLRVGLTTAMASLTTSAQAMTLALFYFDQRVRTEGLDLELALARREAAAVGRRREA